jgi:acyclic terpene utilization AtuA family protein
LPFARRSGTCFDAVKDPLVIANAGGFWGDRNDALAAQVHGGPVDVVMIDYLAEITMSILRRQMQDDPRAGYARDFLEALEPAIETVADAGIAVVTNAGGMNPRACAEAVVALLAKKGRPLPVAVVTGDDVLDRLDALLAHDDLENLDSGEPLAKVRERVLAANVYLGAQPIAEALRRGARVVVTGRCTDSALALGPLMAHFGWETSDWDRLAAGVVAGHVLECGAQASGGNFAGGWQDVPDLHRVGYPIAEVSAGGRIVITKHPSLGGRVTPAVVKEQLLYEIGDPTAYLTPDVSADFTSIRVADLGDDRVLLDGIRGGPPPDELKVSIAFHDGWRNEVALTFVWPDAELRARRTAAILLGRIADLGLVVDAHHVDLVGVSGAHGPMAPPPPGEPAEVMMRMAIRTRDRKSAERFGAEIAPLITAGVPGACGSGGRGRPHASPIVSFWPALVPRGTVTPKVELL